MSETEQAVETKKVDEASQATPSTIAATDTPVAKSDGSDESESDSPSANPDLEEMSSAMYESYKDEQGRDVFKITENGEITKTVLHAVPTGHKPHILGRIWINVKGTAADGTVFEEHMVEERDFILGKGQHCKGVEMALSTMHVGEHALIHINDPQFSYGEQRRPDKCPTDDDADKFPLKFHVALIDSMPKEEPSYEMSFKQQLQHSQLLRNKGNDRYLKNRYRTALRLYNKANQCLDAFGDQNHIGKDELKEDFVSDKELSNEKLKVYLNRSICHIKLNEYGKGVEFANKALEMDDNNAKALIRRAICLRGIARFDEAEIDCKTFIQLSIGNREQTRIGKSELKLIRKDRKAQKEKQRAAYGGFLERGRVKLYPDKKLDNAAMTDDSYLGWVLNAVGSAVETMFSCLSDCCKCKKKNKTE